ncbi:MAG: nuclear transport factor 2 family protein [Alphaproteobacteria bacterium]|nr:nuclear transport factor 2 family protein [Alphaproteobacteria bacterium]
MAVVKKTTKAAKPAGKPAKAKPAAKVAPKPPAKKSSNVTLLKLPRPSLVSQLASSANDKLPPRLQAVVDKTEIQYVLSTHVRGIDRADENLLRSVFHPDATIDLGPGVFQGTGNDYVHWVMGVLQGLKSTHHTLGQSHVEVSGDVALVETYFNAHIRVDKPVGREDVFMGGRNLDRLERRPSGASGVWKIIHRKQVLDWVRTEAVSDIFYHQNPDGLWSSRSKTDLSYQMAQFPGSQNAGKLPAFLGRRYESKSVKF